MLDKKPWNWESYGLYTRTTNVLGWSPNDSIPVIVVFHNDNQRRIDTDNTPVMKKDDLTGKKYLFIS